MLTRLDVRHGDALEAFLAEFDDAPEDLHGYFCERNESIGRAVELLAAWERGEELPDGWVPCTTLFWEIDDALHGVINVRHDLSPFLRELGGHIGYSVAPSQRGKGIATTMLADVLEPCRQLGIDRALLTVDTDNVASCRVVEANGGVLEREAMPDDGGPLRRWYSIDLS